MITSKMGKEDGNRYRNQFGEINTYFLDSIRGLREVIQYDCGEERLANIDQQSEALTKLQGRLKELRRQSKSKLRLCDPRFLVSDVNDFCISLPERDVKYRGSCDQYDFDAWLFRTGDGTQQSRK